MEQSRLNNKHGGSIKKEYKLTLKAFKMCLICCVDHIKLQEYNVINTIKSSDIIRCLDQYKLIENEDFELRNVAQLKIFIFN